MAIKHLISPGIGFTPGSVKFVVTRGLIGAAVTEGTRRMRQMKSIIRRRRKC